LKLYDLSVFIQVDCVDHRQFCKDQGVKGYPTLNYYKHGETKGEKFRGSRNFDAFTHHITNQRRVVEEKDEL